MPEPESHPVPESMTFEEAKAFKAFQDGRATAGMGEAMIDEGKKRAEQAAADQAARVAEARSNPNIIDSVPWATDKPAEDAPPTPAPPPVDRMPGT